MVGGHGRRERKRRYGTIGFRTWRRREEEEVRDVVGGHGGGERKSWLGTRQIGNPTPFDLLALMTPQTAVSFRFPDGNRERLSLHFFLFLPIVLFRRVLPAL